MATKKAEVTVDESIRAELRALNIYGKLAVARAKFLDAPVKKSGVNRYAEFKYFELEDIVPVAIKLFNEIGLLIVESVTYDKVSATVINVDNPEETIVFETPAKDPRIEDGTKMSAIQGLGAYVTYQRRYLYMLVLDIVEADPIDGMIGKDEEKAPAKKSNKPASPEKREEVKKELIDEDGEATEVQIKSIKNGLKKLRAKDEENEPYVKGIVKRIKAGLKKAEAEEILLEISEKVKE